MTTNGPTAAIADWIVAQRSADGDPRAVEAAKVSLIDTIGCLFAGTDERSTKLVVETLAAGDVAAPVAAFGDMATPWDAALVGGTAAHALDYDDYDLVSYAHPGVVLVPAVTAVGRQVRASGATLIDGYLAGYHVMQCIGSVVNPAAYLTGFHGTGVIGVMGAAAAAAKVMGLAHDEVRVTLGIAASLAAGLRSNFGTDVKPLHAGRAAQAGVLAAHLASRGFAASREIVEAERGFVDALSTDGRERLDARVRALADGEISIVDDPPTTKVYPSCGATHSAIRGVLDIATTLGRDSTGRIEKVTVDGPHFVTTILIHSRPTTALEAKFSMEGCIALALVDGGAGLAQFTEPSVARREVQDLIPRVELRGDDRMESTYLGSGSLPSVVTVSLDGEDHRAEVLDAPGSKASPVPMEAIVAKFHDCLSVSGADVDRPAILASLGELEQVDDVTPLVGLLAAPPAPSDRR